MQKLLTLSEKISKYVIAAALIIVTLLPKFPLLNVPGIYVAIRFEDLVILALVICLIPKIVLNFKSVTSDPIIRAFLIFFAVGLVSWIAGTLVTQTVDLHLGLLHWARRIEYMSGFIAAYLLIPKKDIAGTVNFYIKILLIIVFVSFIYGIGERYFHFPVIITQNTEYSKGIALFWTPGSHINATFAGHYDLAGFLVLVIPTFLAVLFTIKEKFAKVIITLTSGMGLWLLINTVSRMAQVSYLMAISIALLVLRKFKGFAIVIVISLVFMLMNSGLEARFGQAIKVLYDRVTQGKSFSYVEKHFVVLADQTATVAASLVPVATPVPVVKDVSISIRANVEWPRAIRAFRINPLLGTGYSSIGLATDNDYLRVLGETGILGFFAFALIFFRIGKVFYGVYKGKTKLEGIELAFVAGIFGAVMGTFLSTFFIDLFEASKFAITFWILLGCAVSLIQSKEYVK
jgi:hypothetical protein